ncbi:hypothetical protein JHK85_007383 [Glycine max]|nr:hypothetical protein JHK85_007383 [Glycine max]
MKQTLHQHIESGSLSSEINSSASQVDSPLAIITSPVVLEIISGLKAVDFRQPEVLLVNKVDEFEVRKRPLEALANMGLNGEYNLKELMTLVSLGAACTHSDPKLRPSTTQIVSILDGNDKLIMGENMDTSGDWRQINACFNPIIETYLQPIGSTLAVQEKYVTSPLADNPTVAQITNDDRVSVAIIADNNVVAVTSNLWQSVLRRKEKGESTIWF